MTNPASELSDDQLQHARNTADQRVIDSEDCHHCTEDFGTHKCGKYNAAQRRGISIMLLHISVSCV